MTNGNVRVVMWKCLFNNVEMRVRWNENTYLIMWKHIFGYGNMRFWLRKDTGTMNRSPTPGGMFATNFVGVRHVIANRQQHYRKSFATYFVCVRHTFIAWILCICKIKNLKKIWLISFFVYLCHISEYLCYGCLQCNSKLKSGECEHRVTKNAMIAYFLRELFNC